MIPAPHLDFLPLLPELIVAGVAVALLVGGALVGRPSQTVLLLLTLAGLIAAAAASAYLWNWDGPGRVLGEMIQADRLAVVSRMILLGVGAFGALYGHHYFARTGVARMEFYPLLLLAVSGMTLLVASADLIVVFLALEILSLALYILVALSFRMASAEASMKYFLLGAFSSAFFLYGLAMAYGAAGTTKIDGIALALSGRTGSQPLALAAVGLLLIGFGFKVSVVPFHMWTPDVYQGAPTSVTAFMAAGTKVAAFTALIRVLDVSFQPLTWDWRPAVWALAAASMVLGSLLAIAQTDLKRLLGYSSIAHAGFILTGLIATDGAGIAAVTFYLVAYSVTVLGAFGTVMLASGGIRERTSFDSFRGLAGRSPMLAGLLTLFLLSLAGIPPTVGFIAKAGVFGSAIRAGFWPLALIGVLASVVGAFFYLRVIVLMYMEEPQAELEPEGAALPGAALALAAGLTLVLGVFPQIILPVLEKAAILRW